MKKLILTAFIASSLAVGPGMLVASPGAFAQAGCDGNVPEAWLRPGGYCDSIGSGKSLTVPVEPGCTPPVLKTIELASFQKGDRFTVAEECSPRDPCGPVVLGSTAFPMAVGERIRAAMVPTIC